MVISVKGKQYIGLTFFLITLTLTIISASSTVALFALTEKDIENIQSDMHIDLLHMTANDGTEMKGLFFLQPKALEWTNHSVPLIFLCHGMSDNYMSYLDFGYSLAKEGYAVFAPEFRGHGSNRARATMGELEPHDLIAWMDFICQNQPAINGSNIGLWGHSMGALYSTLAHIFDSQSQGRVKALVAVSGPLNLTREYDYLKVNPAFLGPIPFVTYSTEKSPVNFANKSFPQNILLIHGANDQVVDPNCSLDFYRLLDPEGTRQDVELILVPNAIHEISLIPFTINQTKAWFDYYLQGKRINGENFELQKANVNLNYARIGHPMLLITLILFALSMSLIILLVRSIWIHHTHSHPETVNPFDALKSNEDPEAHPLEGWLTVNLSPTDQIIGNLKLIGYYYLIMFGAGIIGFFLPMFVIHKLFVGAIGTFLLYVWLHLRTFRSKKNKRLQKRWLKKWLNPKASIYWISFIIIGIWIFELISSSTTLEDATWVAGSRTTWWVPSITALFTFQLTVNILIIRTFLIPSMPLSPPSTSITEQIWDFFKEAFFNGILMGGGVFMFMIWYVTNFISIPGWHLYFNVFILAGGFAILFMLYNVIAQLLEKITHSFLPGAVIITIIFPLTAAGTPLIFFY